MFGGDIRGSFKGVSQVIGVISSALSFIGFFNLGLLLPELEKDKPECFFSLSLDVDDPEP